jgi:hypothetical protein
MPTLTDARGHAVTGATPRALEHYERAIDLFLCHRGDPLAQARAAWQEAPGFVAARQLEAWLLMSSRDRHNTALARRAHRGMRGLPMNARERGHAAALAAMAARDIPRMVRTLEAVEAFAPLDVVAFTVANTFDLFTGEIAAMARRTARAFGAWAPGMPGYHAILSMHAFALEEIGEYGRAEEAGRCALEDQPLDLRAHHAVAHVHEMLGQPEAGIRWMGERSAYWSVTGRSATHHWWHLALFHLQRGDVAHALRIYDGRIAADRSLAGLIDASALLWRAQLAGTDPGARWQTLADAWEPRATDANCAFNDLHAMMAFAGAGRGDLAARLLAAQVRFAALPGMLGSMSRLVGVPASRALYAFGSGDYATAERMLRALPPVAHRIGGSQAQRDVLELTRHHAGAVRRRAGAQSFRTTRPASTAAAPASLALR